MRTSPSGRPIQRGILQAVPALARHLIFQQRSDAEPNATREALQTLLSKTAGSADVVGIGASLAGALQLKAPASLKPFATPARSRVKLPATGGDLWVWLRSGPSDARGKAQGELLERQRECVRWLGGAFTLSSALSCFRHAQGRDLTGYEDGTENPRGRKALAAAIAPDGSSFVALQQWQHQWHKIDAMSEKQRNESIGRVRTSNQELESAPESAHVKRTAQEDFILSDGSEGFSVRRSMPWSEGLNSGLMFVSFGKNFEAFEAQLAQMVGANDGITDALFHMSKPISGAYFWCPPADFTL